MRLVSFWIRRVRIEGPSMLPTLVPGEEVLALRRWRPVRVGDVVVFHVESVSSGLLVKRCVARHGGTIEVRGDNPSFSTDSRNFGLVPTRNVRYLVWLDRGAGKSRPI